MIPIWDWGVAYRRARADQRAVRSYLAREELPPAALWAQFQASYAATHRPFQEAIITCVILMLASSTLAWWLW